MIESGTHTPGISAADFGLPPHTALRWEEPAPALRGLLSSYAVLDSDPGKYEHTTEWMLPTWAQIWIVLTEGPIVVGIGNRRYAPLSSAVLYGVTSRAMPITTNGGVTIGINLSPLGWARWIAAPAEALRDRITPLTDVMPQALVEDLVDTLHASDRAGGVKDALDAVFARHLPPPNPDEAIVARLMAVIADPANVDVAATAAALGVDVRTLRDIAKRYFGFPPKLLMMRTRFLRAFMPALIGPNVGDDDPAGRAVSYHDTSHYLRDSRRFLGMTPRRFLALGTPYLRAAMRARRLVIGDGF